MVDAQKHIVQYYKLPEPLQAGGTPARTRGISPVIARERSDRGDLYKLMKHLNSRHSDGCPQWDTPEESHPSAGSKLVRLWWVALCRRYLAR